MDPMGTYKYVSFPYFLPWMILWGSDFFQSRFSSQLSQLFENASSHLVVSGL